MDKSKTILLSSINCDKFFDLSNEIINLNYPIIIFDIQPIDFIETIQLFYDENLMNNSLLNSLFISIYLSNQINHLFS